MNYWLLKTEPDEYSYEDLAGEGTGRWDGVRNHQALGFMRRMAVGDAVFIYHTGGEKQIVGIAEVVQPPYPDPKLDVDKWVVVDVKAVRRLPRPVALAEIKTDRSFTDFPLVRNSRLSVMPVPPILWRKLSRMGGIPNA